MKIKTSIVRNIFILAMLFSFGNTVRAQGNAIQFNGTDQSVSLGNWFTYQDFTISMWLKPGSTQVEYAGIIDNNHNGNLGTNWVFQQDGLSTNNYYFWANGAFVTVTLAANTWQHVAVVLNSGTISIYLNGNLVNSAFSGGVTYDGVQSLWLANWGGGGRNWNGEMDEVRIYNTALTDTQIQNERCIEVPPASAGLVAYYKMDESTGSSLIADATINALSGTTIGSPIFSTSDALCTGAGDNAVKFNGINQSVELGNWFNYPNFTVSMWLKPSSTQVDFASIIDNAFSGPSNWSFQQQSNITNLYLFKANGFAVSVTLAANTWQHVALVSGGGTISVYLDGNLVNSIFIGGVFYDGSQFLRLADWGFGGLNWNGEMDEVRIYNTALSETQIQNEKCIEVAPASPNLVAYYKMNETTGSSTIADATVNNITGNTINSPTFTTSNALCASGGSDPQIASFSPLSGKAGDVITIQGSNFDPTPSNNTVKFNGTDAVVSPGSTTTELIVTVPAGATTGNITVTVGAFTATSSTPFTINLPGTWTQKTNFGGTSRTRAVGFNIGGKGYIGTGFDGSYKDDFWEYDPIEDTWTQMANFPGGARADAAGFSLLGKGYIGTGYDGTLKQDFWEYDQLTNTWTQRPDFPGGPRMNAVGAEYYTVWGYMGTGRGPSGLTRDFWKYDPSTITWQQQADVYGYVDGVENAVAFADNRYIYVGLGKTPTGYGSFISSFDPVFNFWGGTIGGTYPGTARENAIAFTLGFKAPTTFYDLGYAYIGTGRDSNGLTSDMWELNLNTGVWQRVVDFSGGARENAVGFRIDNRGYIGLGNDISTNANDFIQYKPHYSTCVPEKERKALLKLFNSTNGPNWQNYWVWWATSFDEDDWVGVKVTGCHIEEVDLGSANLQGFLPTELKDLTELDSLVLQSTTNLTGIIPPELGTLSKLKHLLIWASGTNLSGTLPKEIGNLTNLVRLDLMGGHNLTGTIPAEYGNLVNLEILTLQGGRYVSEATSGQTGLTGSIPTSVLNLPKLVALYLNENQLSGPLPSSFSPTITAIDLGGNQFTGSIPASLGSQINLGALYLYRNQLTGSLPSSLGNLPNLAWINIRNNNLTGAIPSTFQNLTKMRYFWAQNNQLEGEIPDSWGASMDWSFRIENNKISKIPKFTKPFYPFAEGLKVENNALDFGSLELNIGKTPVYTYAPQANLPGGTVSTGVSSTLTIPFTTGGTQNSYQWYKDGTLMPGATSQQYSKANAQFTDAGSYTVEVTNTLVTGLTLTSDPFIVTINSCTPPTPPIAPSVSRCGDGTVTLSATGATGTQEYRWYDIASGGTSLNSTATFTTPPLTITTSYYISIFDVATSCESNRTQVDAIVNTPPAAPGAINNSGCSGTSISVSASGGSVGQYRWYTVATGGTAISGEVNSNYLTPSLTVTTSYWVANNDGTCESTRTEVIATVIPLPTVPGVQPVSPVCPGSDVTLTATGGTDGQYRWYDGASLIAAEVNSMLVVTNLTSTKPFQVAIHDGTCESNKTSITATVQNCTAPIVVSTTATAFIEGIVTIDLEELVSDEEDNIDPSRLQITSPPTSGAFAELVGFELQINYAGFPFVGSDEVGIEACDFTNLCTQQQITIELGGDITVHNAVSPDGNGKNEFLTIQYIDILPETQSNKVFIFNRWGDEVFSINEYNNDDRVFKGENKNGSKLPPGTYFYKIVFTNGKKTMTGFLELKY